MLLGAGGFKRRRLTHRVIAGGLRIHADSHETGPRIPEIDVLEVDERAHQEARAHEQRERQRQLADDDQFADAQPCGRSGDASPLLPQPGCGLGFVMRSAGSMPSTRPAASVSPKPKPSTRRSRAAGKAMVSETRRNRPSRSRKPMTSPTSPPSAARHRLSVSSWTYQTSAARAERQPHGHLAVAERREIPGPNSVIAGPIVVATCRRIAFDNDLIAVVGAAEEAIVRVSCGETPVRTAFAETSNIGSTRPRHSLPPVSAP